MSILHLAIHSLLNRSVTVILTICAIAISITLLLGVEKVRNEARLSFANTITGVDLIVGARSGSIQLLLYSVFRIGNAKAISIITSTAETSHWRSRTETDSVVYTRLSWDQA